MIILSFALAMLVTTVTLPPLRKHAQILGLIDSPTELRKVHTESIPHSGGVGIATGVLVASIAWLPKDATLLPLIGSVAAVFALGLLDDIRDLGHRVKFAGQALAAAMLLASYGGFPNIPFIPLGVELPMLSLAFSFLFLLAVTNAVNLSDGLDGLAAGNGLISLIVLAFFAAHAGETSYLVLTLAMAGGLVGFLRFNSHPASMFMGDTGSQFIGFVSGALCILIMQSDRLPFSPMVPILVFGLPLLDTVSVMAIRKLRGRPMFVADRSHLHHQLLRLGFLHYEVVALLYLLQAIYIGLAYVLRHNSDSTVLFAYLIFSAAILSLILLGRIANWRVRPLPHAENNERRNLHFRRLSWFHHNTARVLALTIGAFLLFHCVQAKWPTQAPSYWLWMLVVALSLLWVVGANNMALVARTICFVACPAAVYGALSTTGSEEWYRWSDIYVGGLAMALVLAIRVTRRSLFQLGSHDYLILVIIGITPLLLPSGIQGWSATRLVLYLAVLLYGCEYIATKGNRTRWLVSAIGIACIAALSV